MLWGQGYLRFSVYLSSSKSAVLKPSSDEETPAREKPHLDGMYLLLNFVALFTVFLHVIYEFYIP